MIFRRTSQKGFSLIEVALYAVLVSFVSVLVINAMLQVVASYNNVRLSRDINYSSVKIMERLTRDIKSATSVDLGNSTFGANPGRLTLNTVNASGTPMIVEYYVSGNLLRIKEDGNDKGPLMSSKTTLDGLVFYYINTGATIGIKTELHIRSTRGQVSDVDHFYNTSILRGSY